MSYVSYYIYILFLEITLITKQYLITRITFQISVLYIYQFRVAWKVRCKDDTDLPRYTKDCNLESEEIFPPKLFKGGNSVLKPSRRKEGRKLSDAS